MSAISPVKRKPAISKPLNKRPRSRILIRASAGSGKTFQLSNWFIAQLNAGAACEQILATTFTRKAAGEILDRILVRLADAAVDDRACAELAGFIDDPLLTRFRCLEMLAELCRNLHRLRIGTLDSFFAQVAGSFTLELGLPPGWRIAEDLADVQLRTQAIDAVIRQEKITETVRLMHLLTKGTTERSVGELVRQTVDDLYNVFQATTPEAWNRFPKPPLLSGKKLREAIDDLRGIPLPAHKTIEKAHAKDCELAEANDWDEFIKNGLSAKILAGEETYCRKPIEPPVRAVYNKLLEHARGVILKQLAEQTAATHELLAKFDREYQALKHETRGLRFEDITRRLARAATTEGAARLGFRLDAHISHLLLDEFQDTSLDQWQVLRPFAKQVTAGRSFPFGTPSPSGGEGWGEGDVAEKYPSPLPLSQGVRGLEIPARVDSNPRDTGAATGKSFFCVGDVKQAIYGWRGGVAEIFDALEAEIDGLANESLNASFRSAQPIIDTVNEIFTGIANHANLENCEEPVRKWCAAFAPHTTQKDKLAGYATLVTSPAKEDGEEQLDCTLEFAAERIAEIVKQAPGRSVGVLVRRNAVVAKLIFKLRRLGVSASEEGGNPLTDSAAVETVLSLLRLADHPGDTIARFHVAHSPLGTIVRLTDEYDGSRIRKNSGNEATTEATPQILGNSATDDVAAERLAQHVRRQLMSTGLGPTVYAWVQQLAPSCNRRDLSRLLQLVELAYDYQPTASLRTTDFVNYVARERVSDPTADPVRVMTIHQAKGLEFDVVVLPELEVPLAGQPGAFVAGSPSPTEPIDRVCRYRNDHIQKLLPPELQEIFTSAAARAITETLCVLYVAVTRAVHALHMIVAPSNGNEKKSVAGLLCAALANGRPRAPETVLYEHGDPQWFLASDESARSRIPQNSGDGTTPARSRNPQNSGNRGEARILGNSATTTHDAAPEPLEIRLAPLTGGRQRGLERAAPSGLEGGPKVKLANLLQLGNKTALDRGTLIHAWFAQIGWLDDGPPDEALLYRVANELGVIGLNLDRVLEEFYQMLRTPRIAAVLSRDSYRPPRELNLDSAVLRELVAGPLRLEALNERRFAVRQENRILSGSIDRLVLMYHDDRLVAADILDFKTDAVATDAPPRRSARAARGRRKRSEIEAALPDALAAKVEFYRGQLEAYRPAVAALYGLALNRISARLLMLVPGVVCDV